MPKKAKKTKKKAKKVKSSSFGVSHAGARWNPVDVLSFRRLSSSLERSNSSEPRELFFQFEVPKVAVKAAGGSGGYAKARAHARTAALKAVAPREGGGTLMSKGNKVVIHVTNEK